jgi:AGZA family xanthine/uracil permease-like MFS transporter
VALIERKFFSAGVWSTAAALLSAFGIIHAYDLTAGGIVSRFGLMAAPEFFVGYLLLAILFFVIGWIAERNPT